MKANKKLESLVEESYDRIKEIFEAPQAAKRNLMQTNGKLAINVLNHYKTLRQAESGNAQVLAVIARMTCESKDEVVAFLKKNLPELIISPKQLKK